jgi:hypothetical protein
MSERICTIDGCPEKHKARGFCKAHWRSARRRGDFEPAKRSPIRETCSYPGCSKKHHGHGYCRTHYRHWQAHGDPSIGLRMGESSPLWKGDAVGYTAVHLRLERLRGKASEHTCWWRCGRQAEDWSYDWSDPDQIIDERGRVYSLDPACYIAACRSCHRNWDRAQWED